MRMDNPFENINQRLSNIEGFLIKLDKTGNQVPTIGTPEAVDRYVNSEEAKHLLGGVSSVCLWEWRKKKFIQGYNIGNKVFYKYSELMNCGKHITK